MVGDRSIRIFISSTFRDMHAEREELVKRVFPQLRQLCESRGVLWTEVDLRWGITEAQAERGEILPICLEEIQRCRPYFIGLLGERYGWVPHRLPAGLVEREAWLAEHPGESVTALEILHGVLRNPAMADHAYFYFRDPQWLKQLPNDAHSADFVAESEASARQLHDLKAAIRTSRFPVRENYASPEVLGQLVLEDLTALINRLYPAEAPPSPLDQDAAAHAAFARRLVSLYLPCSGDLTELDRYASEGGSPMAVLGGSGSGKSALLANWAAHYSAKHPDAIVLTHFVGATALTGLNTMLARIVAELQRRAEVPHPLPESPDQLRADFGNWLSMAASKRSVILVLDALNELEDREGARELDWIPRVLPPGLRMIAATLPGASQDAIVKRGWQTLEVKPLDAHQRSQLASAFLNLYGKKLDDRLLARISGAPPCANPLYLTTLVDELRQFGELQRLEQQVDHYLTAPDPRALFRLVLERYQEDYQRGRPDLVQDAFSLILAGRRGLAETELLDLLGSPGQPLPRALWSPLFLAAERHLSARQGLLGFSHEYIRDAVETKFLRERGQQDGAHGKLAEYFHDRHWTDRQLEELPWQLSVGEQWTALAGVLEDPRYLQRAWLHDKYDVLRFWASLERNTSRRAVDVYLRAAESSLAIGWSVANLFDSMGHRQEALALRGVLVATFRRSGDEHSLMEALPNYAVSLRAEGQLDEALELHSEAQRLYAKRDDTRGVALCLGNRAAVHMQRRQLPEAMDLLAEQERLCVQIHDWNGRGRSLNNQAVIHSTWGQYDEALAKLDRAAEFDRQAGDIRGLLIGLSTRANVYRERGSLPDALACLSEIETRMREVSDRRGLAQALENSVELLVKTGTLSPAESRLAEAAEIWEQLHDPHGAATNLAHRSTLLLRQGRHVEALALIEEVERHYRATSQVAMLASALMSRAEILQRTGDLAQCTVVLREAEQIFTTSFDRRGLAMAAGSLGWVLRLQGKLQEAFAQYQKQERICREIGDKEGRAKAIGDGAVVVKAAGNLEAALAFHKQEEQLLRECGHIEGLAVSYGNQGVVQDLLGHPDLAMECHRKEEEIVRKLNNIPGLAGCLGNIAFLLEKQGQIQQALEQHRESERLFRQAGEPVGTAKALAAQAIILGKQPGKLAEARAILATVREIVQRHKIVYLYALPDEIERMLAKGGR